MGEDEARGPGKVLCDYVFGRNGKFHSGGFHRGHVSHLVGIAAQTLGDHIAYEVEIVPLVGIEGQLDSVVNESEVSTYVQLVFLFVGEF